MTERAVEGRPFDRLTPEFAIEVRRNLILCITVGATFVATILLVIALVIEPLPEVDRPLLLGVILYVALPPAGLLLALVYLFGYWPAFLRERILQVRYGAVSGDLSGRAWRRAMRSGEFWTAFTRGAVVGWAFTSLPVLLGSWGPVGSWSFDAVHLSMILFGGHVSARSWFMRRAVVRATVPVPVPQGAEPTAAPDRDP